MKKTFTVLLAAIGVFSCEPSTQESSSTPETSTQTPVEQTPAQTAGMSQEDLVERGKYLVTIGACNDCHSPKVNEMEPDPKRMLSGHPASEKLPPAGNNAGKDGWVRFNMASTAAIGPWGTSFAANLTPDATGIGNWTLDNFKTALREGKYKGMKNGRPLLPPMPWPNYQNMKDQDVEAIFTYLKSLPPVKNVVPAPLPPAA